MMSFTKKKLSVLGFYGFIYFSYYLCRGNLSVAKVFWQREWLWDKESIGIIISLFMFSYAIGQVVNGVLSDKLQGKKLLLFGLSGIILVNLLIPFSSYWVIALLWLGNGIVQSTGWPVCVKSVGQALEKKNRAIGFGFWGTGYQLGGVTAIVLAGYLSSRFGWQAAFFVPACILILPLLLVIFNSPDSSVRKIHNRNILPRQKISLSVNKNVFVLMLCYMCLGFVRHSFMNWGIEYQNESLGLELTESIINFAVIPLGGIAGIISAGVISDKLFGSKRIGVSFSAMLLLACSIACYKLLPFHSNVLVICFLALIGALMAATDCFVGATATFEFAKQHEEGKSIGLVDAFMYIGAISSGYINGLLIQNCGWETVKWVWIVVAFCGTFVLIPLFKIEKKYDTKNSQAPFASLAKNR
jgi:sugar phosphate permease